jgi:hypothetical protein
LQRPINDLEGLVPPAQRQQRLGQVDGQGRAIGAAEPAFAGGCQPLAGYRCGLFMQADTFQRPGLNDGGFLQRPVGLRLGSDRTSPGQQCPDLLHVPAGRLGVGQGYQRGRLGAGSPARRAISTASWAIARSAGSRPPPRWCRMKMG